MTKHTKGPYLREGTFVYALTENTSESARSRKNTPLVNRFTAQVYGDGRDGAPIEELEAVATLFQKAPEMDAAIRALIADWDRLEWTGDESIDMHAHIRALRAALPQETGDDA